MHHPVMVEGLLVRNFVAWFDKRRQWSSGYVDQTREKSLWMLNSSTQEFVPLGHIPLHNSEHLRAVSRAFTLKLCIHVLWVITRRSRAVVLRFSFIFVGFIGCSRRTCDPPGLLRPPIAGEKTKKSEDLHLRKFCDDPQDAYVYRFSGFFLHKTA